MTPKMNAEQERIVNEFWSAHPQAKLTHNHLFAFAELILAASTPEATPEPQDVEREAGVMNDAYVWIVARSASLPEPKRPWYDSDLAAAYLAGARRAPSGGVTDEEINRMYAKIELDALWRKLGWTETCKNAMRAVRDLCERRASKEGCK